MKKSTYIFSLCIVLLGLACTKGKLDPKGFSVSTSSEDSDLEEANGLTKDSLNFETRPSNVLPTSDANIRLTPIYKVNTNKKEKTTFIGSNSFHYLYDDSETNTGNNWNNNIMPGFEAIYGYNMVNVSLYNIVENAQKNIFQKPVLIKTVYYPSSSKDSLNYQAVRRKYIMISVYNEDTNKDGFINIKDLRRFFLFNQNGEKLKELVPENYAVFKSEYDPENDFMYVFAQLDSNKNGQYDEGEPVHIFWIDLKDPFKTGRMY